MTERGRQSRRGRGRPVGESDARERILAAARAEFIGRGYASASMRAVARAAEVDPALVHHYFSDREALFVAAMHLPATPSSVLPAALAGDPELLGERLARLFLRVWGEPSGREPILGLLVSAMASDAAAGLLRDFVADALLRPLTAALHARDVVEPGLHAQMAIAQLLGMAVLRWVVRVEPMASASEDEIVAVVAPALQLHLVGA